MKVLIPGLEGHPIEMAVGSCWDRFRGKKPSDATHSRFTVLVGENEREVWLDRAKLRQQFHVTERLIDEARRRDDLLQVVCAPLLRGDLTEIKKWSQTVERNLHFSRKDYALAESIYVNDQWAAYGAPGKLFPSERSNIKGGRAEGGELLVRKILKVSIENRHKVEKLIQLMDRLNQNPAVLPLLQVIRYTSLKNEEKIVLIYPRMEGDVFSIFDSDEPMPWEIKLHFARWLIAALQSLKGAHGDLKPENILWGKDRYCLCDLENFRDQDQRGPHRIGTGSWSAPEMLTREDAVTEKLDVWPLGLIFYYLFTHPARNDFPWQFTEQPLSPRNIFKLIKQSTIDEYLAKAEISLELKELLSRMIVVNLANRYTIDEAAEHFNRIFPGCDSAPSSLK